jgi:hypothetical protein
MKVVRWPDGTTGLCTDEEAQHVHMNGGMVTGDYTPAPGITIAPEKIAESAKVYSAPPGDLMSGTRPGQKYRTEEESMAQPVHRPEGSKRSQMQAVVRPATANIPVAMPETPKTFEDIPERVLGRPSDDPGSVSPPEFRHGEDAGPDTRDLARPPESGLDVERYHSLVQARILLLMEAKRITRLALKQHAEEEPATNKMEKLLDKILKILNGVIKMDAGFGGEEE